MGTWNLGSVATEVLILVPSIPSTISGTPLERIADRQRLYMEQYTGQTIGSVGIAEKYQPALVDFTCAQVLSSMELEGADVASVRIGEFNVQKGKTSNLSSAREMYDLRAKEALKELGRKINFFQAL